MLLADEPTGQLDSETAKQIMRLLRTVVQSEGVTALVATHDPNLISIADSVLELRTGRSRAIDPNDPWRVPRAPVGGGSAPFDPAPAAATMSIVAVLLRVRQPR